MTPEPEPPDAVRRGAIASLPSLLLALGGACALSVCGAFALALAGRGAPSLPVLAIPPALVLAGFAVRLLRRSGAHSS